MFSTRSRALGAALFGLVLALGASTAGAQDSPFTNKKTAECFSCHAVDPAQFAAPRHPPPKIAGQNADYLAGALRDYRDAQRSHYLMNSPASIIPEDAIQALTEYVEGISAGQLPRRSLPAPDPAARARGARLAAERCGACHTPGNSGSAGPGIPSLNGQYAGYILVTLQDYRLGVRSDEPMQEAAAALSDRQMADLAVFYESLTGLLPARP